MFRFLDSFSARGCRRGTHRRRTCYPEIPSENNLAERMIRPAVIIRKNSQGNRSEHGAAVQAILMTVFQTLKRRGHNPIETVVAALRDYVRTGTLPDLPS